MQVNEVAMKEGRDKRERAMEIGREKGNRVFLTSF